MRLTEIYRKLLSVYGSQGWWPVSNSFEPPEWEICVGAILTQNTAWSNVEKALSNLKFSGLTKPEHILNLRNAQLEKIIRPAGFYRQKAQRLRMFAKFVSDFGSFGHFLQTVTRQQLLELNGIGPETADSILLYACGRLLFVIDGYTKRFYSRFFGREISEYDELQQIFHNSLPRDVEVYKEFHALIVRLSKSVCRKRPICKDCVLSKGCLYFISQKSGNPSKA